MTCSNSNNCCADPCYPSPADVTINQTIVQIDEGQVAWKDENITYVPGTDTYELTYQPIHNDEMMVIVNTAVWKQGTDYLVAGNEITFLNSIPATPTPSIVAHYMYFTDGATLVSATGTIVSWGGSQSSAPTGWLFCNGDPLSQADYAALYAAIGHTYANDAADEADLQADGQFRLPDLQTSFYDGETLVVRKSIIKT